MFYSWALDPVTAPESERIVLESPVLLCVQSRRTREAFQVSGTSPESAGGWSSNVGVGTSTGLTSGGLKLGTSYSARMLQRAVL